MAKCNFPLLMKCSAVLMLVLTAGFAVLQHFHPQPWCLAAAISSGVTAYHLGMRLLVGYGVLAVTGYHFDYRCPWFQPRSWEPDFYRWLQLRRWKQYLPTFDPKVYDLSQNTLHQVIRSTCGSEVVHEFIMFFSFLPLLLVPLFGEFPVFLITSVLSALTDSLFVMTQRYNRPRLVRILEKQEMKTP